MMMNTQNTDFLDVLLEAIRNVKSAYQSIRVIDNEADPEIHKIARERVYCYELYHQLRLLLDETCHDVNGEIDKSGHHIIVEGFNPDIVIHKQGSMEGNKLVLEAKVAWDNNGVKKDFKTLYAMTEYYRYDIGIFLFVGKSLDCIKRKIKPLRSKIDVNSKIYVICVKQQCVELCTLESIFEEDTACQP
jgi:hypothetical protein